jgi:hypothetical protein
MSYAEFNKDMVKLEALVSEVAEIYNKYIDSPYLRKAINRIEIEKKYEQSILSFQRMTTAGLMYDFAFFYEIALAFAVFCDYAYFRVAPGLGKTLLGRKELEQLGLNTQEQSLCKILIDSFPSNIKLLAQKVSEMYQLTVDIDSKSHPSKPFYSRIKDLERIDALLYPILSDFGTHLK